MGNQSDFINLLKKEKKIVRVTFLGDGAVGKTTLITKFLNLFPGVENVIPDEKRTPFLNIAAWKQNDVTVQCFDLAGQRIEKGHPLDFMSNQVLGALDIIFFVFTLDRFSSFENLETWYEMIENKIKSDNNLKTKVVLVGNKSDLDHQVDKSLIDQVITNGMFNLYIQTSALEGEGITEIADHIYTIGSQNLGLE